MSSSDAAGAADTPFQPISSQLTQARRQYQQILDKITPFVLYRWLGTAGLLNAHAIYLLNLLLAFLQPKFDPSLQDDLLADEIEGGGEEEATLPSQRDDEFRPFVRRLPEWQFWCVLRHF
ncbi:hypothetical protein EIP86_003863 [Pleurotus ostreatoroseus]|nr:hypothetical protein EIP86_003863 [Pleurotus ostreatoroseus]